MTIATQFGENLAMLPDSERFRLNGGPYLAPRYKIGSKLVCRLRGRSSIRRSLFIGNGWVTPSFDWTEWQDKAEEYVERPTMIETADAATIQKLFTTHVRKERFCEGHLAAMFENGHVVALLLRLRAIRGKQ